MQTENDIPAAVLASVRNDIIGTLSEKRASHIFGVERMAIFMGNWILPNKIPELSLAALLHDVAKELSKEEMQAAVLRYNLDLPAVEFAAPATLHARVGAYLAEEKYPEWVTPDVKSAIWNHTVGAPDMTVFDKIIFLSDLIEDTRTWPFCLEMREMFLSGIHDGMTSVQRLSHLDLTVMEALRGTIVHLTEKKTVISPDSVSAYNALLIKYETHN